VTRVRRSHLSSDADQRLCSRVKFLLERDDDALQLPRRLASDERSNLANVRVVQGSVDLIEHEKRRGMVATREEQPSVSTYSK
jgi:hypothetical protein